MSRPPTPTLSTTVDPRSHTRFTATDGEVIHAVTHCCQTPGEWSGTRVVCQRCGRHADPIVADRWTVDTFTIDYPASYSADPADAARIMEELGLQ